MVVESARSTAGDARGHAPVEEAPRIETVVGVTAPRPAFRADTARLAKLRLEHVKISYGEFRAVRDVSLEIPGHAVTAIIGPSGCGTSTFIRTLNRMHDLVPGDRVERRIELDSEDIYGPRVHPVQLRRIVGMVIQRPNPLPTMS